MSDPISSLFGGGGSTSSSSATSQQVGAQGNQGPVFGAITTKGGGINLSPRSNASYSGVAPALNKRQAKRAKNLGLATTATGSGSSTPTTGQANIADAGGGSGNVNIQVTSGDIAASTISQGISESAILAQNDLATKSLTAQSALASKTLDVAADIATSSFALSGAAQLAATGLAATGIAAGFGQDRTVSGSDVTGDQSVTQDQTMQPGTSQLDGKTLAIIAAIAVALVIAIK